MLTDMNLLADLKLNHDRSAKHLRIALPPCMPVGS